MDSLQQLVDEYRASREVAKNARRLAEEADNVARQLWDDWHQYNKESNHAQWRLMEFISPSEPTPVIGDGERT